MRVFYVFFILIFHPVLASTLVENGSPASQEDLLKTGTVAIVYEHDGAETSSCTGVRISPNAVLTAAHCVFRPFAFPKGVRASLDPLNKTVPVEKVSALKFPYQNFYLRINFGEGYEDDIAILILEEKSDAIIPEIAIPVKEDKFLQLGYGMEFHRPTKEIYPLNKLLNGVLLEESVSPFHFSIMNPQSSMRSGDSGGPVFIRSEEGYKLAGVLSSGNPRPLSEITDGKTIYMSAYHFVAWIRELIEDESFASHLSPVYEQFPIESKDFITVNNVTKVHQRLCQESRESTDIDWYLSEKGTCLPKDEEFCLRMRQGKINFRFFSVRWNAKTARCEEI